MLQMSTKISSIILLKKLKLIVHNNCSSLTLIDTKLNWFCIKLSQKETYIIVLYIVL